MDVSTAIHYYEAILASLAILVWHFYFIFLNPDVAPMNKAWSKGYLTREQMEHEHPLELEGLDKKMQEEKEEAEKEAAAMKRFDEEKNAIAEHAAEENAAIESAAAENIIAAKDEIAEDKKPGAKKEVVSKAKKVNKKNK